MVSSTSTGRSPRLLARPALVRPRGARGTPERASRNPEARASPGDEMASAGETSEGGVRLLLVGSPPDVTRVEAGVDEAASLVAVLDNASAREALDAVNTLTTSLENGGCVG